MTDLPAVKNPGEALCIHYQDDLQRALGYELISGHLSFGNFLMAVKEDVMGDQRLREAFQQNPGSAVSALVMAAQCKLLPGAKYELFYLTTRMVKGRPTVVPIIGYKGLMEMSKRHPRVHSVEAFCVYQGEDFDVDPGQGTIRHKWRFDVERTDDKIVAVYAKAIVTEPNTSHVVDKPIIWPMSISDVHKSRARSDAWKYAEKRGSKDSPWHTDFPMMARKTAVRQLLRGGSVPRDMGVGGVLSQEEAHDSTPIAEQPSLPKATTQSKARAALGLDKPTEARPFDYAEEAVAAIQQCNSIEEMEALASRWQHFQGSDAETIGIAYEDKERDLLDREARSIG
jgi:phage RecT family recombinase